MRQLMVRSRRSLRASHDDDDCGDDDVTAYCLQCQKSFDGEELMIDWELQYSIWWMVLELEESQELALKRKVCMNCLSSADISKEIVGGTCRRKLQPKTRHRPVEDRICEYRKPLEPDTGLSQQFLQIDQRPNASTHLSKLTTC